MTKNIIFSIHFDGRSGLTFDFTADIETWKTFVANIEHLEFRGQLVNHQFTVKHFEPMLSIKHLYIGSTDYVLFENEDISKLPMIPYVGLNGYGMILGGENMEKWLNQLKVNGCVYDMYY